MASRDSVGVLERGVHGDVRIVEYARNDLTESVCGWNHVGVKDSNQGLLGARERLEVADAEIGIASFREYNYVLVTVRVKEEIWRLRFQLLNSCSERVNRN